MPLNKSLEITTRADQYCSNASFSGNPQCQHDTDATKGHAILQESKDQPNAKRDGGHAIIKTKAKPSGSHNQRISPTNGQTIGEHAKSIKANIILKTPQNQSKNVNHERTLSIF